MGPCAPDARQGRCRACRPREQSVSCSSMRTAHRACLSRQRQRYAHAGQRALLLRCSAVAASRNRPRNNHATSWHVTQTQKQPGRLPTPYAPRMRGHTRTRQAPPRAHDAWGPAPSRPRVGMVDVTRLLPSTPLAISLPYPYNPNPKPIIHKPVKPPARAQGPAPSRPRVGMVYVTRLPPSTPLAISCIWPLRVPISSTTCARSLSLISLTQPYPSPNPILSPALTDWAYPLFLEQNTLLRSQLSSVSRQPPWEDAPCRLQRALATAGCGRAGAAARLPHVLLRHLDDGVLEGLQLVPAVVLPRDHLRPRYKRLSAGGARAQPRHWTSGGLTGKEGRSIRRRAAATDATNWGTLRRTARAAASRLRCSLRAAGGAWWGPPQTLWSAARPSHTASG
jgi:hypothetical protein